MIEKIVMDSINHFRQNLYQHCDGSETDKKLCQLILAACEYPENSIKWRKIIHCLLFELQNLPGLLKSSHPDYLEALNQTWQWFVKNLNTFDPRCSSIAASLLIWINRHLGYQILALYNKHNSSRFVSLDNVLPNIEGKLVTSEGIEGYIEKFQQKELQNFALMIQLYIETDPEAKLRQCHPRNYPDCNCQLLGKYLFLQEKPAKISAIARELNINVQTIHSFWKRKGFPLLQKIVVQLAENLSDEDLKQEYIRGEYLPPKRRLTKAA